METNTGHGMFISEQYGWLAEVSGEFFDQILVASGVDFYFTPENDDASCIRDNDLMLMGLWLNYGEFSNDEVS